MTTNIQNNLEKNNETSNFFSISKNVKKQTILKNLEENNTINDICSLNSGNIFQSTDVQVYAVGSKKRKEKTTN